jgi:hypothetical protein
MAGITQNATQTVWVQRGIAGAVGGIAGGIVFGMMMGMMGDVAP